MQKRSSPLPCTCGVPPEGDSSGTARLLPDLAAAYAQTDFIVEGPWPVILRVDDAPGCHDGWLKALGACSATVITAWNPLSVATPDAVNAAANRRLLSTIEQLGLRHAPAIGSAEDGTWAEDGWCVLDVPEAALPGWLQDFAQNAALRVQLGGRPELVWHPRLVPLGAKALHGCG